MYTERFYRSWTASSLESFRVVQGESDLQICAERNLRKQALLALAAVRKILNEHIAQNPVFERSLTPLSTAVENPLVKQMEEAGRQWNTGPMASVAGAIAQEVGTSLLQYSRTVIVENGGDIWASAPGHLEFLVYPGELSPFAEGIRFSIDASEGISVCTSSGKVGPSFSLGRADAVTVIHSSAATADAAATSLANRIHGESDVTAVVEEVAAGRKLKGIIAVCGESLGIWGDIHLTEGKKNA